VQRLKPDVGTGNTVIPDQNTSGVWKLRHREGDKKKILRVLWACLEEMGTKVDRCS